MIEAGNLEAEVARAYALLDEWNASLDDFEAERPEVAVRLPWHGARQAWKADGRPRAPWYEALRLTEGQQVIDGTCGVNWPREPRCAARLREQVRRNHKAWYWRREAMTKAREEPSG